MKKPRWILAAVILSMCTIAVRAETVDKSIDVTASPEKVWAMIGPFCSIKDWHPAIGECTLSGGVRTLTTKDGRGRFIEKQTASELKTMTYSYEIEQSPLPLTNYQATLKVVPKGDGTSKVEWSSSFTPNPGQTAAAKSALEGIYQAGLDNIQKMAAAK